MDTLSGRDRAGRDPRVSGMMAGAEAVYEQFLLTPLKLKQRRQEQQQGAEADGAAGTLAFDLASETDEDEREPPPAPPAPPAAFASPELERLRGRIASADLSSAEHRPEARDATSAAVAQKTTEKTKKKKRATRSVAVLDAQTGAARVDTPSKAGRPAKRSRASADTDKENRGEGPALALVRRRISDSFGDGEADERRLGASSSSSTSQSSPPSPSPAPHSPPACSIVAPRPVRSSRRLARRSSGQKAADPAPDPAVDMLSPLCDALVATDTISGLLFALSLNALRYTPGLSQEPTSGPTSTAAAVAASPVQSVFAICRAIAQCELLTQQQFKRPTVLLSPKRRHSGSAQALEKVLAVAHSVAKSPVKTQSTAKLKKKTEKKSVRFRSFDFSCLSLQYVENEHVAAMVDRMIAGYGELMDFVVSTLDGADAPPESGTLRVLRQLAAVMASEACLLTPSAQAGGGAQVSDDEAAASARIVEAAYSSQDSMTQHEIRLAGAFFARQFDRLVPSAPPTAPSSSSSSQPAAFLHEMFSALISSAVRYKLRLVFLHAAGKDEDEKKSKTNAGGADTSPAALAAATYAHQDVGAAIHRALQESLLYLPLASPLLALLDEQHADAVADHLKRCPLDDVERVDQFILARRFLRFHLTRALNPQSPSAELTSGVWLEIERACSIAQRFHFEDEAHLFPLASVHELQASLESEDARLARLDRAVQEFWESQDGYEAVSANGPQECSECRSVITRAEAAVSITCTLCASRFHLRCLHLPDSFAQFAAHYTCPACFLGRSRMEY